MFYFYGILLLLILSTVSTYAWFLLTKTPRVSNFAMYINSDPGMELALSPYAEDWTRQIRYDELIDADYKLKPATWSDKDQRFYGAVYGFDGRRIESWEPLTDERHSNTESRDNYYIRATLYARSNVAVNVSLAPATTGDVDKTTASGTFLIPEPIWNEETICHDNGGKGAEAAVRIALKITRLNADLTESEEPPLFYIYEPNANIHTGGESGYLPTPSIDGTEHLIDPDRILRQTASMWGEADPVQKDMLTYYLGEFEQKQNLFDLAQDETVRIDLYIWLEGQDVDCTNAIESGRLLANLQFLAEPIEGTGPVPIPPEE